MTVSGWFVALLAAGAVPIVMVGEPWVLPAWIALALALAGVDLALAASPRDLTVTRTTPQRVRLGETVDTRLTVTNRGRRRLRARVRDAWPPTAGAAPTRARLDVPAGERRSTVTRLTPMRRGTRRAADVTVRAFGPLRLAARQATLRAPASVVVLPPFHARRHLPSRLARLRELDGATSLMVRGEGTEFDGLRDYVRGDDVRSIDWRATARRAGWRGADRLVVRTWRPERDRRVVIVVDSGRAAAARVGDETRLDTAFEAALLLGVLASRAGDRVDVVVHDRRVRARVQGAAGSELLARSVEAFADVESELIASDWSAVPGIVDGVTRQRSLVVLLTTQDSVGAARELLAALPRLTARHLVLVAGVDDPAVRAAAATRGRVTQLHLAGAAERQLADEAAMAEAVRRLGGDVVRATPAALPPAVADRYLAYKAAGRL